VQNTTRASQSTVQQADATGASMRGQASNTSAGGMSRETSSSLDSQANARQKGNRQTQQVSQFQRGGGGGFDRAGGGGGGRSKPSGGGRRR
jgi:hypothetical protein